MSPSECRDLVAFLGDRFDAVDRSFDELRAGILGHFDDLYRWLERYEQEHVAITQALRRIEAILADGPRPWRRPAPAATPPGDGRPDRVAPGRAPSAADRCAILA